MQTNPKFNKRMNAEIIKLGNNITLKEKQEDLVVEINSRQTNKNIPSEEIETVLMN